MQLERHVDAIGRLHYCAHFGDDVSALDLLAIDAGKVQRHALPGPSRLSRLTMDLETAHACDLPGWLDANLLPDAERSGPQRPRHDRADCHAG